MQVLNFFFALLAWGLIEKIEPTPKVSVHVMIYCDFSRIFNILLVLLNDGRIFATLTYSYTNIGNNISMQRWLFRGLKKRHSVVGYIAHVTNIAFYKRGGDHCRGCWIIIMVVLLQKNSSRIFRCRTVHLKKNWT